MHKDFKLLLFAHEPAALRAAVAAGLSDFMVDCEWRGKTERQTGADTDTSHVGMAEVAAAAAVPGARITCRINSHGEWTAREVDAAIAAGATRVFLPMVRRMSEAEHFLRLIDGRVEPAILVETLEAVRLAPDLARLPLSAVYVGLNDLAISRGSSLIFEAVLDGTVARLRDIFDGVEFGFGGVTLPGCGHPVPGDLLLAEMQRLECDFSFMRRSFHRDVQGKDMTTEVARLRDFWRRLGLRNRSERNAQHQQLQRCLQMLLADSPATAPA
ncbi:aldolase [Arenimonas oryziterrae]|uniref:HpcH/HpaI aldolase/citrate lyase domain-containing protein n=1 Tax=Arenimonas oryziterrae DSM 21050 = YC6267 TaxID=1121015 RepID=A0A091AZA3_9GAMM|nr:aldolase [Arenimonas oryziterrae]KFN44637.1 hypothetical protein N789_01105 [Arenimonas oryziterrae DSM 21050 = YC6267]